MYLFSMLCFDTNLYKEKINEPIKKVYLHTIYGAINQLFLMYKILFQNLSIMINAGVGAGLKGTKTNDIYYVNISN